MKSDMSRILIETLVKNTLKDLRDSPERSVRNLVHMALKFSEGRFQHEFFEVAGTMLENEQSSYYDIIKDTTAHVETDRLLKFGMNLGYNSCTAGAKKIRELETSCGYNIPWTIVIRMDEHRLRENPESYDSVISQGEEMGIYTWMLYDRGQLQDILPLIQEHTDSAFILFCEPSDLTPEFLNGMSDVKHLMLAVRYEENSEKVYGRLRKRRLLYSTFYIYGEKDVQCIDNEDLFYSTQQMHPLFTALIPEADCGEEIEEKVYHSVIEAREKQNIQTIPWDLSHDNRYVDSIISDDSCFACFDEIGRPCICQEGKTELTLFDQSLSDILKQMFPKKM